MVAQKFGKADPDIRKGSKETRDKSVPGAGARTPYTGMIGGPSNEVTNRSSAKSGAVGSFKSGGMVRGSGEGGFRNRAMEHKR